MIKIEKDVPMPAAARGRAGRHPLYPWLGMKVDDSFIFPGSKTRATYNAKAATRRYKPQRFKVRTIGDVIRIWRTA